MTTRSGSREVSLILTRLFFNHRFGPIVQGLLMKSNEQLRTESLILINAIITQPDDLDFRMHLRNEFMRVGLLDVLDVS